MATRLDDLEPSCPCCGHRMHLSPQGGEHAQGEPVWQCLQCMGEPPPEAA